MKHFKLYVYKSSLDLCVHKCVDPVANGLFVQIWLRIQWTLLLYRLSLNNHVTIMSSIKKQKPVESLDKP